MRHRVYKVSVEDNATNNKLSESLVEHSSNLFTIDNAICVDTLYIVSTGKYGAVNPHLIKLFRSEELGAYSFF